MALLLKSYIYNMKTLKQILLFIPMLVLTSSLFQCASVPKLQKEVPGELEDVYFQKWNAGIEEGSSGINIFIKIKDNSIRLDSVYFRGKVAKLQANQQNNNLYVARFKTSDKKVEIPFDLGHNDCVISYTSVEEIIYFKMSNLREKETINYPSSSSNY